MRVTISTDGGAARSAYRLIIMPIRPGWRGDRPRNGYQPLPATPNRRPRRSLLLALPAAAFVVMLGCQVIAAPTPSPLPGPVTSGQPGTSSAPTPLASSAAPASAPPSPSADPTPGDQPGGPTPPPATSPTLDPATAARLQARLDKLRATWSLPGVSVAILWDDGRRWVGATGKGNLDKKAKLTPDAGFALASISKTYTAAVVLQLVEEGRLRLDESAARWLPALKLDKRITVRMLLDHTSGLPDFFKGRNVDRALLGAKNARWALEQAWRYVPKGHARPGSTWIYSNTNYLLLGELVSSVTGRSLATEIRQRLLQPLGLRHTWFQDADLARAPLTRGYRMIRSPSGRWRPVAVAGATGIMPFRSVVTAAGGAGSIAATAEDVAVWMHGLVAGDVLDPATRRLMIGEAAVTKANGARIAYGLGIQVVKLDKRTAIGHSGRYLGYQNVARYLPGDHLTIVVLTNQSTIDPARIASVLLRIAAPAKLPEARGAPSPSPTR